MLLLQRDSKGGSEPQVYWDAPKNLRFWLQWFCGVRDSPRVTVRGGEWHPRVAPNLACLGAFLVSCDVTIVLFFIFTLRGAWRSKPAGWVDQPSHHHAASEPQTNSIAHTELESIVLWSLTVQVSPNSFISMAA